MTVDPLSAPAPPPQFRHGLPGYAAGPYETAWRKGLGGKLYFRRVGDRQAAVQQLAAAQWRVTITPVTPRHGRHWEPCGPPVELGVYNGRKVGRAAADEYLAGVRE